MSELSTQLSTGLAALAVSGVALGLAIWAVSYARKAIAYAYRPMPRELSLSKLAEHDAQLTELLDSYNALLKSHKKLRSRIGMRENRDRKKADDDDTSTDWKTRMRQKLLSEGKLNARFHSS